MLLIIWNEVLSVARFQSKVGGSLPILILIESELFEKDEFVNKSKKIKE